MASRSLFRDLFPEAPVSVDVTIHGQVDSAYNHVAMNSKKPTGGGDVCVVCNEIKD